jgi:hypothetical protein
MNQAVNIQDLFNWPELVAPNWYVECDSRLHLRVEPISKPETNETLPADLGEDRPGYQRFEKDGRIWYSPKKPH